MSTPTSPSSPSRLIDFTTMPGAKVAAPPRPATLHAQRSALQGGQRFIAAVVVVFIFGTTALSLYDLYLFLTLVAR